MLPPVLVTPPSAAVVSISDMKLHLKVDSDDDESEILQMIAAAVADLDGWKGSLRRCIMPQTWAVSLPCGTSYLPFPDVSAARIDGVAVEVLNTSRGPSVSIESEAVVEFDCALPSAELDRVVMAVKLIVRSWYDGEDVPPAYDRLVNMLAWPNA